MNHESVIINGLSYELDNENYTAKVVWLSEGIKEIYIPRSIVYNSHEYIITSLIDSLTCNCTAESVIFSNDSEVRMIDLSFSYSNIKSIVLPPKIEKFKENWCGNTSKLVHISLSPTNKKFTILDEKILLGKTDETDKNYDVLIFACRDIKSIIIPSFIKYITASAFSECKKLKKIQFSENSELLSIDQNAFAFLNISSFYIPKNVIELKDNWCYHCPNLKKITISSENKNFKFLDEDKGQIVIGKTDFSSENYDVLVIASRDIVEVEVSATFQIIRSSSFAHCCYLKKITFSNDSKLESIGKSAFCRSSITEIKIPRTVRMIGKMSFMDTVNLRKVDFDVNSELLSIEDNLFTGSKIESIFIPSHVKRIGHFAFSSCSNLESLEFGENSELEFIGDSAFSYSKLGRILIPKTVKSIGEFAFFKIPELSSIEFEDGSELVSISPIAFAETSIESISIPKHVKVINERTFMNIISLKWIEFPTDSELTTICSNAFVESSLESINFPARVEKLEKNWCNFTAQLTNISISPYNQNFTYLDNDRKIIVEKSNKESDVFDVILFASRDIEEVVIPSFITRINSSAFSDCTFFNEVKFLENSQLYSIGDGAFSGCSLINIVLPESVKVIEKNVFILCSYLESVEFLADEVTLDSECLSNSGSLSIVSFPRADKVTVKSPMFYFVSEFFVVFMKANADIVQDKNLSQEPGLNQDRNLNQNLNTGQFPNSFGDDIECEEEEEEDENEIDFSSW